MWCGLNGGISKDAILGLLGMYFDAAVVFVTFTQIGSSHTVFHIVSYCVFGTTAFDSFSFFNEYPSHCKRRVVSSQFAIVHPGPLPKL